MAENERTVSDSESLSNPSSDNSVGAKTYQPQRRPRVEYQCQPCNKMFKTKSGYYKHMRHNHKKCAQHRMYCCQAQVVQQAVNVAVQDQAYEEMKEMPRLGKRSYSQYQGMEKADSEARNYENAIRGAKAFARELSKGNGSGFELLEHLKHFAHPELEGYITIACKHTVHVMSLINNLPMHGLDEGMIAGVFAFLFCRHVNDQELAFTTMKHFWTRLGLKADSLHLSMAKDVVGRLLHNVQVVDWIFHNIASLTTEDMAVLTVLKDIDTHEQDKVMQMQRVLMRPVNQKEFNSQISTFARILDSEDNDIFNDLLAQSLTQYPNQRPVDGLQLLDLLYAVRKDISLLCLGNVPVSKWPQLLEQKQDLQYRPRATKETVDAVITQLKKAYPIMLIQQAECVEQLLGNAFAETWQHLGVNLYDYQAALTTYIAGTIDVRPKQLWQIPSGSGKTLVMIAIVLRLSTQEPDVKICIVNPVAALRTRDASLFTPLWVSLGIAVEYAAELREPADQENLVQLFDEADTIIFGQPQQLLTQLGKADRVIMFTGTLGQACIGTLTDVMKHHGVHRFDFVPDWFKLPVFEKEISHDTLIEQINKETSQRPVIIFNKYDNDHDLLKLPSSVKFDITQKPPLVAYQTTDQALVNQISHAFTQGRTMDVMSVFLDKIKANDKYPIVVVNNEDDLRGIDFRAPKAGLLFVMAASFSNERAYMQALGRVGRMRELCSRWKVEDVSEVDQRQQLEQLGQLRRIGMSLGVQQKHFQPKARATATQYMSQRTRNMMSYGPKPYNQTSLSSIFKQND